MNSDTVTAAERDAHATPLATGTPTTATQTTARRGTTPPNVASAYEAATPGTATHITSAHGAAAPTPMSFIPALSVAAISGWVTANAFPGLAWWPAVFLGQIGLVLACRHQRFWRGCAVGAVYGVVFFGALVHWLTMYLGVVPWIALTLLMGLSTAAGIGIAAATSRFMPRSVIVNALVIACILAGREVVTNHVPWGGFAWGRIGVALAGSPFQASASWIGVTGTSILVVWVSAMIALLIARAQGSTRQPGEQGSGGGSAQRVRRRLSIDNVNINFASLGLVVVLLGAAAFVPAWGSLQRSTHTIRVAAVQGNANAGLLANPVPGSILARHVEATQSILHKSFDVMIWPENASDLNPFVNAQARAQIDAITNTTNRPLIFGTVRFDGRQLFNSSVLWTPQGPQQIYNKQRPVPFAEYMPHRAFFHALAPSLVDLITHNYAFGTAPGIMTVDHTRLGILICFESSIDELVRNRVASGAQVLIVQSNNSDFGRSVEAAQQFANTHMQAIVSGRAIVNVSTVASSAVIDPNGTVRDSLKDFEPGTFIANVPAQTGTSPGLVVTPWIELVALVTLGGGALYTALRYLLLSRWRARAAARRS